VAALPPRQSLLTPFQFTEDEDRLLEGTPLFEFVSSRKGHLKVQWKVLQRVIGITPETLPF
jgi:hypothetical protein